MDIIRLLIGIKATSMLLSLILNVKKRIKNHNKCILVVYIFTSPSEGVILPSLLVSVNSFSTLFSS